MMDFLGITILNSDFIKNTKTCALISNGGIKNRLKLLQLLADFFTFLKKFMKEIESYRLGKVQVTITETDKPNKLNVECFDGEYHSEFTVSEYEFKNYRRLMNQRITQAYKNINEDDG